MMGGSVTWRQETIFATPWFSLVSRRPADVAEAAPFYSVVMPDYVCVVARTVTRQFLFVRQYRPAVERLTIELPAGTVDPGETPEHSIRRELAEETGYCAGEIVHLGTLLPDSGRLSNRMWCYWADDVRPSGPSFVAELGVEPLLVAEQELSSFLSSSHFEHALHLSAFMLAVLKQRLVLS